MLGDAPEELLPTRHSLLSRIRNWADHASWEEFFNTYWRLIYGVARRSGLNDAEAQDVVQETILAVARTMPDFKYDPQVCPFKGWLLRLTRCRIVEHHRKRQRRNAMIHEGDADPVRHAAELERVEDPAARLIDAMWDEEWEKNLLFAALDTVKFRVSPIQFQIFDCYVLKEWPVREVARALDVNVGQVYLAKHRVSSLLKSETRRLAREWENGR